MLEQRYLVQGSEQNTMEVQLHGCNNSSLSAVNRFEMNVAPSGLFGTANLDLFFPLMITLRQLFCLNTVHTKSPAALEFGCTYVNSIWESSAKECQWIQSSHSEASDKGLGRNESREAEQMKEVYKDKAKTKTKTETLSKMFVH